MSETEALYRCDKLVYYYQLGEQQVQALNDINLTIHTGEFLSLAGPSGSGKTTLLNILGLIEKPQQGDVHFSKYSILECDEARLNQIRRFEIGFIFQNFHLIESLNAYENVEYFLTRQKVAKSERATRVENALRLVGLWDKKEHRPLQLSGGQKQRVAIARALAKNPKVIIGDEPTASLDQTTGHEIMDILKKLNREQGVTIVLASHDPMVLDCVDRVVHIQDGHLKEGQL